MSATLVTGAAGCLGAWVTTLLARDGERVVAYDLGSDARRLRLVAAEDALDQVTIVEGDVTNLDRLERVMAAHGITTVIHLAGLQAPHCAADPVLGAHVNVGGTATVFEAARRAGLTRPISWASSAAAASPPGEQPSTLYGVYKRAAEGVAERYATDFGVWSVGLRPACVYGPGRDRGTTAGVTQAIVAAGRGEAYRIPFATALELHYAADVARAFIDAASRPASGATVRAVPSEGPTPMPELVAAIERVVPEAAGLITVGEEQLPFPGEASGVRCEMAITPLEEGIRATVALTAGASA